MSKTRTVLPRVLFVSPVADFKGGAEVVLRNMLANPHIEAVLAVPEEGAVAAAGRAMGIAVCCYQPGAMLNVHRPPRPGPIAAAAVDVLRCAFRLRALARQHGCQIVHSNGLKAHMLCAVLGRLTRTRTLVHLHDIPYSRAERAIWRAITGSARAVVLVSAPCYPGPALPPHAGIVPNGVRMMHDTLPPSSPPTPLRLGFVGRFHPNKGMDLLLDWFGAIRRSGVAATLTIRGRPDPDLPEYWTGIQARIRREGLDPFITRDGWTEGAATYAGLDMLLVSSQTPDPAPLVVAEAMSAGVIVAGYPAGGIPGMIEDGHTGLLVQDGASLARRLQALVTEPGRFEQMRRTAFERTAAENGMERFHSRLATIYHRMLSGLPPFQAA